MWQKIRCLFGKHKLHRTSVLGFLCLACDKQVFVPIVDEQGKAWGKRQYADRKADYWDAKKPKFNVDDDDPKFAVS